MFNFPLPIFNPSECFAFYRYVLARHVPSHYHLVEIFTVDLGISSIGYLYYLAIKSRMRHPESPPLIKIIGGSSHAANIPNSRLEEIFRTVAEATGINHGFLAFHRSRSGRVDFHFLFVNSTPEGRLLVQSLVKFRKAFRKAMREVVHAYNLERLDDGGLSIGNLSPKGRAFFVEPPQPEPTPEIAQPAPSPSAELLPVAPDTQAPLTPATAPDAPMDTEPPPSEPAPLQTPVTTSPDIDPAIPTSDVAIPPAAEGATTTIGSDSPSAFDRPANCDAYPSAPSTVTPAAASITQTPKSLDPLPPSAKSVHAITQIAAPTISEDMAATTVPTEPTGKVESLPTPSATAESGPIPAEIAGLPGPQARIATDSVTPLGTTLTAPVDSEFTAAEPVVQSPRHLRWSHRSPPWSTQKPLLLPNRTSPRIAFIQMSSIKRKSRPPPSWRTTQPHPLRPAATTRGQIP